MSSARQHNPEVHNVIAVCDAMSTSYDSSGGQS